MSTDISTDIELQELDFDEEIVIDYNTIPEDEENDQELSDSLYEGDFMPIDEDLNTLFKLGGCYENT